MQQENIDILDRQSFVNQVKEIIQLQAHKKCNVTFAIDGQWGVGKTFVLEMLEEQLKNDYIVFHFNAWEYDYYDEPLIALLTSSIKQLEIIGENDKTSGQIIKATVKTAAKAFLKFVGEISKNKLGVDIPEMAKEIYKDVKGQQEEDTAYNTYLDITKKIEEVKDQLRELSKIKTVIFVVDELDRCLPEYAIKVLERLHHVFTGVENLQVILSVDKKQLDNTIKTIFGETTNADHYLQKFIHFFINLSKGDISVEKWRQRFEEYENRFLACWEVSRGESIDEFLEKVFSDFTMRDRCIIIEKALNVHDLLLDKTEQYDITYMCLELLIVIGQMKGMFKSQRIDNIHDALDVFQESIPSWKYLYKIIKDKQLYSKLSSRDENVVITHIKADRIWGIIWHALCQIYELTNVFLIDGNGHYVDSIPNAHVRHVYSDLDRFAIDYQKMCSFIQ